MIQTNTGVNLGLKISEAINSHRLGNFLEKELQKLNLDPSQEIFIYNTIRFDNFFFQKRFIFVVVKDQVYIKKQMDKKSKWISLPLKSIKGEIVEASFTDKMAIVDCGKMIKLENSTYPEIFKNGKRFLVEKSLGTTVAEYDLEMTESFISKFI